MKKRIAVIFLLIVTAVFSTAANTAFGDSTGLPLISQSSIIRINENTDIAYLHITKINAFYAYDGLYFSDGNNLYRDHTVIGSVANGIAYYKNSPFICRLSSEEYAAGVYYNNALVLSGELNHISVLNDNLYVASGKKIELYTINYNSEDSSVSLNGNSESGTFTPLAEKTFNYSSNIEYLCATSKAVFIKLSGSEYIYKINASTLGGGTDIGRLDTVDDLKAIAATSNSDFLFCLTNNQVIAYTADDMLSTVKSVASGGATLIAAGVSKIYLAAISGGSYTVNTLPLNFNSSSVTEGFFISRSEADYFYKAPSGVASRFGNIYVADTTNNRISVLSAGGITQLYGSAVGEDIEGGSSSQVSQLYYKPKSIAVALNGDIFVAHQFTDTLTGISNYVITNHSSGKNLKLSHSDGRALVIEKMLIGSNGTIYVLATYNMTGETFAYSADQSLNGFTMLSLENPSAIGFKASGEVLFYADGAVRSISGETVTTCETLKDFGVDYVGRIFGINAAGNLVTIDGEYNINHGGSFDRISISNIVSPLCGFGDLLLLETSTNSLKKVDAAVARVADVALQFDIPDIAADNKPHAQQKDAIAAVKYETSLFTQPTEANIAMPLEQGRTVFVRRDIDCPDDMYYVIVDSGEDKLVGGYVYRSMLDTDSYEYKSPAKNTALLANDHVDEYKNAYKYPSMYAPVLGQIQKGELIKLLDFAINNEERGVYLDIQGKTWVRIAYGNNEGYMLENGLNYSLFSNRTAQPNVNATITSDAPVYTYNSETGEYEFFDAHSIITKNTRVEVETPFDSSAKYTRIIFATESGEVIDIVCYVETKYVDFDGADVLQIILIAAIIISLILIFFLTVWIISKHRKRKYSV